LLGALGLSDFFDRLLNQARVALPPDAYDLLARVIGEIRGQPRQGLLSASILLALWAASTGMRSVMNALDVAYDVEETRPAWKRYPLSILYTIGLVAVVVAAAAFRLIGPWAAQRFANQLGLTTAVATLWTWLHWPVVVLLLLLTVALIYYLGPNIDQPFRYVTPGSVSAVVVWILASLGFTAYVENFGNYGATYGSLGGMIVLLLYLFVSSTVLLLGAEINAVIHPAHGPRSENVTPGSEMESGA
jgi:membrane protein